MDIERLKRSTDAIEQVSAVFTPHVGTTYIGCGEAYQRIFFGQNQALIPEALFDAFWKKHGEQLAAARDFLITGLKKEIDAASA